jgi:hypothetical protein
LDRGVGLGLLGIVAGRGRGEYFQERAFYLHLWYYDPWKWKGGEDCPKAVETYVA